MKSIQFRTIFTVLGVVSALCLASPMLVGFVSASLTYAGKCYGFTDSVSDCSWWEYAQNEMFWGSTLALTPAIFLGVSWMIALGFWFALRLRPGQTTLPTWQAILIPFLACSLGACLIYLIPAMFGLRR